MGPHLAKSTSLLMNSPNHGCGWRVYFGLGSVTKLPPGGAKLPFPVPSTFIPSLARLSCSLLPSVRVRTTAVHPAPILGLWEGALIRSHLRHCRCLQPTSLRWSLATPCTLMGGFPHHANLCSLLGTVLWRVLFPWQLTRARGSPTSQERCPKSANSFDFRSNLQAEFADYCVCPLDMSMVHQLRLKNNHNWVVFGPMLTTFAFSALRLG